MRPRLGLVFPHIGLTTSGCHKFVRSVVEQETADSPVVLAPHEIEVRNACGPCCHCEDYVKCYERLRKISSDYGNLIELFNKVYTESMETRKQLIAVLQERMRLVQARLGEWGEDAYSFYVILWVTITATSDIIPPKAVKIVITENDGPLPVRHASIAEASNSLTMRAGIAKGDIQLTDIAANYMGAKTVRLRVRFESIKVNVHGEV